MPAASSAAAAARNAVRGPAASAARPPAEDPAAKPIPVAASSQANPSVSTAWESSRSVRVKPAISAGETVHPAARGGGGHLRDRSGGREQECAGGQGGEGGGEPPAGRGVPVPGAVPQPGEQAAGGGRREQRPGQGAGAVPGG